MLEIKQKPKMATFKRKRDNYDKKKIKKLLKYLRSELGSCTTHGVPYIVNTKLHWFERLFWVGGILLSAAFIVILVSAEYARYLAAPTIMSVEMDYFNWNVSFPAITLCPFNKNSDELHADSVNETLIKTGLDLEVLGPYFESISLASLDSIRLLQIPAPDIIPLIQPQDYARIAAKMFRKFESESLTTNTKWPMSVEPAMTEMGMCHVINSNVAAFDNPSKWGESGRFTYTKNNMELSFYDSNFFLQILNYADSYKIYIESPDDIVLIGSPAGMPFDDEGVLSFGVQITSIKASPDLRAMALYLRKCRFVDEPDNRRYSIYSYNRCLMECRIRMIKIFCGCLPHFYKPLDDERVCNLAELKCLVDYTKEITTLSVNNETMRQFSGVDGLPRDFRDCGCLGNCETDFYNRDSEHFHTEEDANLLKIVLAKFPKSSQLQKVKIYVRDICSFRYQCVGYICSQIPTCSSEERECRKLMYRHFNDFNNGTSNDYNTYTNLRNNATSMAYM